MWHKWKNIRHSISSEFPFAVGLEPPWYRITSFFANMLRLLNPYRRKVMPTGYLGVGKNFPSRWVWGRL